MPIWPTHNHELLPDMSSLLTMMLITNLNSWMILFAEVLGSEYAGIATLAPTLVLVWGFSIRIESASSIFYWAQYVVVLSHLCTQSRRAGVLLSLSINVYYFLLSIYIPLLLNFFRGAFRSADLGPAHRFLMENGVAMSWIYHEVIAAAVRGEHGQSDDSLIMTLATIVLLVDNYVIMGEVAFWQTEITIRDDMLN
ncbi:hypothetical protein CUMW_273000 [Citrus unshiu]|uniref:Uncharacterized protein n=1 Tax=Citrus unshiu TaxID=55188 RepID=A0A2H5MVY7_CITUN|nr:hypothetical protein CUMW_273000 [Citrus unshiu]